MVEAQYNKNSGGNQNYLNRNQRQGEGLYQRQNSGGETKGNIYKNEYTTSNQRKENIPEALKRCFMKYNDKSVRKSLINHLIRNWCWPS